MKMEEMAAVAIVLGMHLLIRAGDISAFASFYSFPLI